MQINSLTHTPIATDNKTNAGHTGFAITNSPAPMQHHGQVAGNPTGALVAPASNPLLGNAAEIFNRAGVISITQPTRATLTFETENTDFRNALVMYKLDAAGNFATAEVVFPNASAIGSGGRLIDGTSTVDIDLDAGDQIGFALVPNAFSSSRARDLLTRDDGSLQLVNSRHQQANLFQDNPSSLQLVHVDNRGRIQPINGEYGNTLFHSTGNEAQGIRTNADGFDHADQIVDPQRGKLLVAMDDKREPVNADRNSLIFSMNVGRQNAEALGRSVIDDLPRSFREVSGADRRASIDEIMTTARMFDKDGDGRLNAQEWAEFAPLLNLTAADHRHVVGLRGRGDIDSIPYLIGRGDADGDGRINEREVLDLGRRLNGNNPAVIESFREAAGVDWKLDYEEFISTAEAHDGQGDGLDQEEWNRFAPVLGLTPADRALFLDDCGCFDIEKFKLIFPLADENNDGHLDVSEVLELRRIAHENFAPFDFPDPVEPAPSNPSDPSPVASGRSRRGGNHG